MGRFLALATLAALAWPAHAGASPRFLPEPPPEPLGELVNKSKTIHVLQVAEISPKGVSFKTTEALKGKPEETPFHFLGLMENAGCEGLFHNGDTVLCFLQGNVKEEGDAVGILFVGGRWALAVSPIRWRGEKEWFCKSENGYAVTFVGSTANLREHVATLVAGRETTITARAPLARNGAGDPRLWRIKAGPGVTRFVLSDESPYFVGWGSGEPDEVPKLVRSLGSAVLEDRLAAAADLAHLGAAAQPALPSLRRALSDKDPRVNLAAASALVRLGHPDEALIAVKTRMRDTDVELRCSAARTLRDLGPAARSALPEVLEALEDKEYDVRAGAAAAVGSIAANAAEQQEVADALVALLKEEKEEAVRVSAIESLRHLGPHAWKALPLLRQYLLVPKDRSHYWRDANHEALSMLARLDPPPIDLLADLAEDERAPDEVRRLAMDQLGALGPRARAALPALRRVLRQTPTVEDDDSRRWNSLRLEVLATLLTIDPEGSPTLVLPILLEFARTENPHVNRDRVIRLVANCGAAARPGVPDLLGGLDPRDDFILNHLAGDLVTLLKPENRDVLPLVRAFAGQRGKGAEPGTGSARPGRATGSTGSGFWLPGVGLWPAPCRGGALVGPTRSASRVDGASLETSAGAGQSG